MTKLTTEEKLKMAVEALEWIGSQKWSQTDHYLQAPHDMAVKANGTLSKINPPAETMSMREAIEKGYDFMWNDFRHTYNSDGTLTDHYEDCNRICPVPWILKNQNEQVKIIKE